MKVPVLAATEVPSVKLVLAPKVSVIQSVSTMVTVDVAVPIVPADGAAIVAMTVSLPSQTLSFVIEILKVLVTSPGANVSVPAVLVMVVAPEAWVNLPVIVLSPLRLPKVPVDPVVIVTGWLSVMPPLSIKILPDASVMPAEPTPKALLLLAIRYAPAKPLLLIVVGPV